MKKLYFASLFILLFSVKSYSQLSLVTFSTGFTQPVDIKNAGADDSRLFIVERLGYIKIIDSTGAHRPGIFLDIHTKVETAYNERGLLGLAFPPDYHTTGYFYCYYTQKTTGRIHVSRFSVSASNPDSAVSSSEQVLLDIYHWNLNHDGGDLNFGPDGYLYIGTGDGGSQNDPGNRSQNLDTLMGKLMRIDVSGGGAYTIPSTNPFVGVHGRDEIWAYGLRNPWRWSFDRWNGDIWIGDVGQDHWEEVDYQRSSSHGGENYGWHCYEGLVQNTAASPNCTITNKVDPILVKNHTTGMKAIIGGYVYRGAKFSGLFGKYFYTDNITSAIGIRSITHVGNNFYDSAAVSANGSFTSMGEDAFGELYVANYGAGTTGTGTILRFQGQTCLPVAYISDRDTLFVCGALSTTLHTPNGNGFHYVWSWSGGPVAGDTSSISITQGGDYHVTVIDTSACLNTSSTVHVSFVTAPVVSFSGLDTLYCIYNSAVPLTPSPVGGTFSGHGVSGTNFDPSVAGVGTHTIYYTYSDGNGCTETSSQSVRVDICAGVTDHSLVNVSLFPNPNTGNFILRFYAQKDEVMSMEVTDVLGQPVYKEDVHISEGAHQLNFSVPGISNGIYSLNIYDGKGSIVKNFVVN